MKTVLIGIGVWFLSNFAAHLVFDRGEKPRDTSAAAALGSGSSGGTGGSGGSGGGSAPPDFGALADAIAALAAGVKLPNIQTVTVSCTTGSNELVAGIGGQRVCVLGYALSGAGSIGASWRSGNSITDLWGIDLNAIAGNSGANVATAWPGYLFATGSSDALNIVVTAAARVSVSYWQEAA